MVRRLSQVIALALTLVCGLASVTHGATAALATDSSTSATFRPSTTESNSVLRAVATIMTARLRVLGDGASTAAVVSNAIVVHLIRVTHPTYVLSVLGSKGQLLFRPVLCAAPSYTKPAVTTPPSDQRAIPSCSSPYRFTPERGGNLNIPPIDDDYAAYPTTPAASDDPAKTVILDSNGSFPSPRLVLGPAEIPVEGREQLLSDAMIASAHAVEETETKQWSVVLELTHAGSHLFNAMAAGEYGDPVDDDLDGSILSAPVIETRSFPSSVQMTGNFTAQQASGLAAELSSGPLPLGLELERVR